MDGYLIRAANSAAQKIQERGTPLPIILREITVAFIVGGAVYIPATLYRGWGDHLGWQLIEVVLCAMYGIILWVNTLDLKTLTRDAEDWTRPHIILKYQHLAAKNRHSSRFGRMFMLLVGGWVALGTVWYGLYKAPLTVADIAFVWTFLALNLRNYARCCDPHQPTKALQSIASGAGA